MSNLLFGTGISDIICATLSDDTFEDCEGKTNIELECNHSLDWDKMLFVEASDWLHCDYHNNLKGYTDNTITDDEDDDDFIYLKAYTELNFKATSKMCFCTKIIHLSYVKKGQLSTASSPSRRIYILKQQYPDIFSVDQAKPMAVKILQGKVNVTLFDLLVNSHIIYSGVLFIHTPNIQNT